MAVGNLDRHRQVDPGQNQPFLPAASCRSYSLHLLPLVTLTKVCGILSNSTFLTVPEQMPGNPETSCNRMLAVASPPPLDHADEEQISDRRCMPSPPVQRSTQLCSAVKASPNLEHVSVGGQVSYPAKPASTRIGSTSASPQLASHTVELSEDATRAAQTGIFLFFRILRA